jgi:hypothetical protein
MIKVIVTESSTSMSGPYSTMENGRMRALAYFRHSGLSPTRILLLAAFLSTIQE